MTIKQIFSKKIIIILLIVYAIVTSIIAAIYGGDFDVFLDAGRKLGKGENIYVSPFAKGLQYYYSNFFALLLMPFSYQVFVVEFLWIILSYFLLYRTFKLIEGYFDFSILNDKQKRIWIFTTILLSVQFILYNVSMIQVTFFLLWAIFESFNLISKGKNVLGGSLLAFAINVKLMPILILPFLFYRGYFKALFTVIVTFIVLLYVPAIFIGYDYNNFLLVEWWKVINPTKKEHLIETGMHSIVSLIPVYLTETVGDIDFKRNILNLSHQTVGTIVNLARLFILSLSLFYLRTLPFKKENNKLKSFWEFSFFALIIPLLLPHQQKYAFILCLPMISYLLYFYITTYKLQLFKKSTLYYISFITFIISMFLYSPLYGSDVIGEFLFIYTQHYKFLTFATLFVIPISIYCNPKKLNTLQKIETDSDDKSQM